MSQFEICADGHHFVCVRYARTKKIGPVTNPIGSPKGGKWKRTIDAQTTMQIWPYAYRNPFKVHRRAVLIHPDEATSGSLRSPFDFPVLLAVPLRVMRAT